MYLALGADNWSRVCCKPTLTAVMQPYCAGGIRLTKSQRASLVSGETSNIVVAASEAAIVTQISAPSVARVVS